MAKIQEELISKRTLKSKVFALDDGQRLHRFFAIPQHYEDEVGNWQDIDTNVEISADGFRVTKAAFDLFLNNRLSNVSPFRFNKDGKDVGLYPRGLRWSDKGVVYQDSAPVDGIPRGSCVSYPAAFGALGDLSFEVLKTGVRKIVKLNPLVIKNGVEYLEVGFEIVGSNNLEVWYQDPANQPAVNAIRDQLSQLNAQRLTLEKQGSFQEARAIAKRLLALEDELQDAMLSKWDQSTDTRFIGNFQLRSDGVKIYGRAPLVWDSKGVTDDVVVELRKRHGQLYFTKLIPVTFLQVASFPVFTDGTTSYYAASGDGYVRRDTLADNTWTKARDTADGTAANSGSASYSNQFGLSSWNSGAGYYNNYRFFFPTDTSGIDDAATISAAVLQIYIAGNSVTNADSSSLNVVQTSQASTSTLATTDYDNVTFTSIGSLALASIPSGSNYKSITITDLSAISKTGYSMIGVLNSRDVSNSAPTGVNRVDSSVSASEDTGTSKDPYIDVTASASYSQTVSDTTTATTAISRTPTKALLDTITSTTAIVRDAAKVVLDTITSTTASLQGATKVLLDAVTSTTVTDVMKILSVVVTDTVAATTDIIRDIGHVLLDTVTSTTSAAKGATRVVLDTVTSTTAIGIGYVKVLMDTALATTAVVKDWARSLIDTVTSTTAATAIRTAYISVVDTITSTTAITTNRIKNILIENTARAYAQTRNITVTLNSIIINLLWRKRTKPSTTWRKRDIP